MNATVPMNESSCSSLVNPKSEKVGITIALCCILVASLIGNTFIGIIVYQAKAVQKAINYFIVNVAMSDLLFTIFYIPFCLANMYADSWLITGPFGQVLCKVVGFLPNISITVSIQSLVLIAVDRFGAVVFPLRSPLISSKLCFFFILASWIVAIAMSSPYLLAYKLIQYPGEPLACYFSWDEVFPKEYSSFSYYILGTSMVLFYIPCALLAILYSIILIKFKSQNIPGEQLPIAEKQRAKTNRLVLNIAIAIVLGFALCWLPISIINILNHFEWADSEIPCEIYLFDVVAWIMSVANCAVNPVICFVFSENYRQGLKRIVTCSSII